MASGKKLDQLDTAHIRVVVSVKDEHANFTLPKFFLHNEAVVTNTFIFTKLQLKPTFYF